MKVLYNTFIVPTKKFGGGICVLQSLYSLSQCAEIDYIGPKYEKGELESYKIEFNNANIIDIDRSKIKRLFNMIFYRTTSGMFNAWKKEISTVDSGTYDAVYLDFSRQAFVVEWAKKNKLPVVVRMHNVEADYYLEMFKKNRSILNWIHMITAKQSERICLKECDKIIVLSETDKKRIVDLYGIGTEKIVINPVCVELENKGMNIGLEKPYILLAGSLWFGPNAEGAEWFLKNVWKRLDNTVGENYDLYVVGANPNEEVRRLASAYKNVKVISNPEDIKPFYQSAELFLAPIFYGAGMKVKVAEALSFGIPVVATEHALIGYEKAESVVYKENSIDGFTSAIIHFLNLNDDDKNKKKYEIKKIFDENYSLKSSVRCVKEVFKTLMEE